MLAVHYSNKLLNNVGMERRHIVVFMDVFGEIIKMRHATLGYKFPVTLANGHLVGFVKLPVEIVMTALPAVFAEQGGKKGYAIEIICGFMPVCISLCIILNSKNVAEGRHHVPKGYLSSIDTPGLDITRPPHDERYTYATFVGLAFKATQLAVAPKVCRVSPTLLVRSVVATENDDSIVGQPFPFQQLQYLPDISIEAGYHSGKLGMNMVNSIVAATFAALKGSVGGKTAGVGLDDGVLRLHQLSVR